MVPPHSGTNVKFTPLPLGVFGYFPQSDTADSYESNSSWSPGPSHPYGAEMTLGTKVKRKRKEETEVMSIYHLQFSKLNAS